MSIAYRPVMYDTRKAFHDAVMVGGILVYLALFMVGALATQRAMDVTEAIAALRTGLGSLSVLMLHYALAIGPLTRLYPSLMPFIRNRRHFGVATFFVTLAYATVTLMMNYTGGAMNPVAAALLANLHFLSIGAFPFEIFGFAAILILAAMAFTSHDFWMAYLGVERWKRLHMLVYAAFVCELLYVVLGSLQTASNPVYPVLMALGSCGLVLLHWRAAQQEHEMDSRVPQADAHGWLLVGPTDSIPVNQAVIISTGEERVAVFRHWQGFSAISNVCAHQLGPIGEGEMSSGYSRCPWHGSLYNPHNGTSPPPLLKWVPTYDLKLEGGNLYLNPVAHPPGTPVEPIARPDRSGGSSPTSRRGRLVQEFFGEGAV